MATKPVKKLTLGGRSRIQVFYTKGHTKVPQDPALDPLTGLTHALLAAKQSIVFGIFSFTAQPILDAFLDRFRHGVAIYGVGDARAATSPTSKTKALHDAGIDIKLVGTQYALMHLKVAVIDDLHTAYGSYNWTTAAERSNDEILTVVTNRQLASVATEQIEAIRKAAV